MRKRLLIARRKRSRPKDRKRALPKRFETLDERHYKTHVPFRPWCPVCVEAKGIEDPHHCAQHGREHEIPLVAIDYKSFGQSGENEHYKGTALIVKDRDTKTIHGHIVNEKGVGDGWILSKLMEDIDNLGYTELILKGGGEPALVQVMNEVKRQRPHKTILEHPPAYDPMSDGAVEKAVDQFMCQFRAIKTGLERRIGQRVETHEPVLTWIAEHAAMMLNRYQVGRDGRTAYRRTVGKECVQKVVEFGEQVHVKPKRRPNTNRKQSFRFKVEDWHMGWDDQQVERAHRDHSRWLPWFRDSGQNREENER